jgi:hypothetical protein
MPSKRLFILPWLTVFLLGALAACGENSQPASSGQVPRNTAAPIPTVTAETPPQITSFDPNLPIPTPIPYPTRQPVAGIPMFGTTIYLFDKGTNLAAQDNFLEAYGQGKPGQWEAVFYTIEGVPISFLVLYQGNGHQIKISVDATKDGFAAPEDRSIRDYSCQDITKTARAIQIKSCSDGKETNDWEIPLP